jgi:hypothetical protein
MAKGIFNNYYEPCKKYGARNNAIGVLTVCGYDSCGG